MTDRISPDPLAEAKVYLAYGREDQAKEVLEEALRREPSRTDLQDLLQGVSGRRPDSKVPWPTASRQVLAFFLFIIGVSMRSLGQGRPLLEYVGWAIQTGALLYLAISAWSRQRKRQSK